jgi:hypothetical protein
MSLRALLSEIHEALKRIEHKMTANDDALTALQTAVTANTVATEAAVTAIGSGTGSDDISAGVNAQTALVEANTTALNDAVTPPAPAGAADGTATPGAVTNEAGTVLPPA